MLNLSFERSHRFRHVAAFDAEINKAIVDSRFHSRCATDIMYLLIFIVEQNLVGIDVHIGLHYIVASAVDGFAAWE